MRFLLLSSFLALVACSGDEPASTTHDAPVAKTGGAGDTEASSLEGSVLINGDFEAGRERWFAFEYPFWGAFNVVNEGPTIGKNSGRLLLDGNGRVRLGQRRASLMQDLEITQIPTKLAGRYYVETWDPAEADPWIEVAVGVFRPDLKPPSTSVKITAYPLAGKYYEGVIFGNRKTVPTDPVEVVTGEWIDFEVPVLAHYLPSEDDPERVSHWGVDSPECERVRVFCTVRVHEYDREAEGVFSTEVRFDDLRVIP